MKKYRAKHSINFYASLGIAGLLFFVVIVIILHFFANSLNPISHYISEYARESHGWLLNIALCGNMVSLFSLAIILHRAYMPPVHSWISITGITITAVTTTIIANIFPADLYGKTITVSGYIHNFSAFIGTVTFLIAANLISFRLKTHKLLGRKYVMLILFALISSILFICMLLLNQSIKGFVGIIQRIFSLTTISWMLLFFYGIRSGTLIQHNRKNLKMKK